MNESELQDLVRRRVGESVRVKQALLDDDGRVEAIARVAATVVEAYRSGGKLIFFGNGGSAADATHLAAEMVGRYLLERAPLPALALADNISSMSAIGNDYSYEETFSRQVNGLGRPGDVAVGMSTSGNSRNVVLGLETARERGITTVGLVGERGGRVAEVADHAILVPSAETPRIQEGHMLIGHTLCEIVELELGDAREG